MVNKDTELDQHLAAYKEALDDVKAPAEIEARILAAVQSPEQPKVRFAFTKYFPRQNWLPWGFAAVLAVFGLSVVLSPDSAVSVSPDNPKIVLASVSRQYPVRVHSLARGAEWRFMQSQVIKDQRGNTRLVVVNPAWRSE